MTKYLCAVEQEFLRKRQLAWEESFRSLYYKLRNGICNIFYGIPLSLASLVYVAIYIFGVILKNYGISNNLLYMKKQQTMDCVDQIFLFETLLVCTPHFVVMFNSRAGLGRTKCLCNAFVSQSTRGLRSLLREHVS